MDGKRFVKDQEALSELSIFANFIHGTHVAAIAAKGVWTNKIMPVKLIPTEVKLPFGQGLFGQGDELGLREFGGLRELLLKMYLGMQAKKLAKLFDEITQYINAHGAKVANASFGTGAKQLEGMVKGLFELAFSREPTEQEMDNYVGHFFDKLNGLGASTVKSAPDVLFVFAAGNDGNDIDRSPMFPAGIKDSNTITVAATDGRAGWAKFSNYGVEKVDVAAPGVTVYSAIPGDDYLRG